MTRAPHKSGSPSVDLVVAMTNDYVIGFSNKLPWRLSADLKRFRRTTTGHVVVMGRKTYESIGRPLPRRTNVVISRKRNLRIPGCTVFSSLQSALTRHKKSGRVFVIGGGQLYGDALPFTQRIYLTLIELDQQTREQPHLFEMPIDGDAYFPRLNPSEWKISNPGKRRVAREKGAGLSIENEEFPSAIFFRFLILERRIRPVAPRNDVAHFSEAFDLPNESPQQRIQALKPSRKRLRKMVDGQKDLFGS